MYTITVLGENSAGVLHRITAVFTRRKINIESLCVSETETRGISRFTIRVKGEGEQVRKVVAQIERCVEVVKASFAAEDCLVARGLFAFFRVRAGSAAERTLIEEVARRYGASVAHVSTSAVVIEKTGREQEVDSLRLLLEPLGLLEFVRSGPIAMTLEADELPSVT